MRVLHSPFGLKPALAELYLAAHAPLVTGQVLLVFFEAVERREDRTVRQRDKASDAHVDTNGRAGGRHRLFYFTRCLNAQAPLACAQADRSILKGGQHLTAQAQAHPAQLGQEEAGHLRASLIEFERLGIGVAKALATAHAFETREVGAFGEEVFVRPLQVFQRVLQRVSRGGKGHL